MIVTLLTELAMPATTWVDITPVGTEGSDFVVNDLLTSSPTGIKFYRLHKQ